MECQFEALTMPVYTLISH